MRKIIYIFIIIFTTSELFAHNVEKKYHSMGNGHVSINDNMIVVNSGKIERVWSITDYGLLTKSIKNVEQNREYPITENKVACDWDLPNSISEKSIAKLISIDISEGDDDGFISKYIEVKSTFRYETEKIELQHVIWLFPDATGLRTQLRIKSLYGFSPEGIICEEGSRKYYGHTLSIPSGRAEYLPLDLTKKNKRLYWGYFNDPGSQHDQSRDMLKEHEVLGYPVFQDEDIDWASGAAVEFGNNIGVMVVKESQKCVNQKGHNTGSFYNGPEGLKATGWGLTAEEFVNDRFRECWANWTIVYSDGNDGMQLALKRFDRTRYPIFPERDIMIINDTWGPADPGGRQFAEKEHLLKEIPLLADLGVDVLRIDDGWQVNPWKGKEERFLPNYDDQWESILKESRKYDVKLGVWFAALRARQEDLIKTLKDADIVTWKVDYDNLIERKAFETRFKSIREVMKTNWMKTQFTFCPEYNHPRYGWYYAKEYGSIYFQNIQEALPEHLIMVPYNVLRQHWLMSKYFNSNKLQVLLQNPKRVDSRYSDAPEHSHSYCFAMGVPFVPVFFQAAQYLDQSGRDELKEFIANYKEHREEIFSCYSFPIGDIPSNDSWSGFQFINEQMKEGYLLIFREINNEEKSRSLQLKFIKDKKLQLIDVESGKEKSAKVSKDGFVTLNIDNAADYKFYKYIIK